MKTLTITEPLVTKLIQTVDAGLCSGKGDPIPGQMCVEAAVCYAMGLPHSDRPQYDGKDCVGAAVRAFKINLNDSSWSSNAARAAGMRKLAVAQLGSSEIDQRRFVELLAEKTIRRVVPVALRAAAARLNPKHAEALEGAAKRCEAEGTRESALDARKVAKAAADAAYAAYAYAAYAAAAAADAAYAAYADAAYAAAAYAKRAARRDEILRLSADIGLEVLQELKSPGCEWLHLCERAIEEMGHENT